MNSRRGREVKDDFYCYGHDFIFYFFIFSFSYMVYGCCWFILFLEIEKTNVIMIFQVVIGLADKFVWLLPYSGVTNP